MTVYAKVLIPAKIAENTQTTQYTASGVTTIIDKFTATNYSANAATISVNLVTLADTAGNQNLIVKTKSLQPAETYTFPEIVGQTLAPGGFISTIASAATISVNLVTSADTAGNQNLIVKTKSLQPAETYTFPEIVGQTLAPGGFISTIASAATSINIRSSGREITQ